MNTTYQRQISALGWAELRSLWQQIQASDTPQWPPGRALEYLVIHTFQLDGATVRFPYSVRLEGEEVEQIDGAVHWQSFSCLVETKDFAEPVNVEPIAKLRNQLLRRPGGTIGLVFSRNGFTQPAKTLAQYVAPQTILLWTGKELDYSLAQERILDFLVQKYRVAVEQAQFDYLVYEETL